MKTGKTEHRPDTEKADQRDHQTSGRFLNRHQECGALRLEHQMDDDASENVNAKECERRDEQVEIAVVSLPDAIAHPGAMMVEAV